MDRKIVSNGDDDGSDWEISGSSLESSLEDSEDETTRRRNEPVKKLTAHSITASKSASSSTTTSTSAPPTAPPTSKSVTSSSSSSAKLPQQAEEPIKKPTISEPPVTSKMSSSDQKTSIRDDKTQAAPEEPKEVSLTLKSKLKVDEGIKVQKMSEDEEITTVKLIPKAEAGNHAQKMTESFTSVKGEQNEKSDPRKEVTCDEKRDATQTTPPEKNQSGEAPKEPVVVKKIIKVKKKKLKPKIDVIETPSKSIIGSCDEISDSVPVATDITKDTKIAASTPKTTNVSNEIPIAPTDATVKNLDGQSAATIAGMQESKLTATVERDDKEGELVDSVVVRDWIKSLERSDDAAEATGPVEKFALEPEARTSAFVADRDSFDANKSRDDIESHKPQSLDRPYDFTDYTDGVFINNNNDDHNYDDHNDDKDIENDDVMENITKYLNKKLSRETDTPTTPTSKKAEVGGERRRLRDLDDSDYSDLDDSRHESGSSVFKKKVNNFPGEPERERGEAFMDQVRRERSSKTTRQRRNSLFLPKRTTETDDKVSEKSRHVKALIDKQTALIDHMGATIDKFAEMENLIRELKAESLEQRAELENLEDVLDVVYGKYKNEIAAAAEALRMQKKDIRDRRSKSDVNSMLRDIFASRKAPTRISNHSDGGEDDDDDDDVSGRRIVAKYMADVFHGKEQQRDDLKQNKKKTKKNYEFNSYDTSTPHFDESTTFGHLSRTTAKPKLVDSKSIGADDGMERKDNLSLSAAEFIDKIRNKYAIDSPDRSQKAVNSKAHLQSAGVSFMDKYKYNQQLRDDGMGKEDFHAAKRTPLIRSFDGPDNFESSFKLGEFKAPKIHQPERVSVRSFNFRMQNARQS